MFDPDGYLPVPYVVALLAMLGQQGKLPRRLGFVHPGDVTNALDLSAEATARFVLGEKLAANAVTAEALLDPSGLRLPVPAYYWRGASAAATMETGWFDLNAIGFDATLHTAHVILAIDKVAAALGIRLVPNDDAPAAPKEAVATEATSAPDLPTPPDAPTCARERFDFNKAKAEFTGRKVNWQDAGRVTPAPAGSNGKGDQNSSGAVVLGEMDPAARTRLARSLAQRGSPARAAQSRGEIRLWKALAFLIAVFRHGGIHGEIDRAITHRHASPPQTNAGHSTMRIHPEPDLADLPRRVDRRCGAALVTQHYFPVSSRSLETWPLDWVQVNSKATCATTELFEVAQAKLDAALTTRTARRRAA